ncbi:MAG: helix-turn-helix domain-containing protein [Pseudobutyrivibrio sp.]|nr:helix-turn-helix domain-containing protein [Pseudobutyrivibrio sp.]
MSYMMKELRNLTGLSQEAFAREYRIPLSTLRKWEQGNASPAPYVLDMLAGIIPGADLTLEKIETEQGVFFYNSKKHTVTDQIGNSIRVSEDLSGVDKGNLRLYVTELYEGFYEIQNKFNRDCKYDKEEGITWI